MAAVVGVPDARLSEVAVAFVQVEPGGKLTEREVIEHCRGRVASFKTPRHIAFVDEFPMTSTGKIQKVKLRERARSEWPDARRGGRHRRNGRPIMSRYNVISADSHIVEPPDLYESRIEPKFRSRAPRHRRHRTRTGQEYDAWYLDGVRVGTVGSVIQAGRRFEDPGSIDFSACGRTSGRRPTTPRDARGLEADGVWGACLQPSQGLFWYRLPDSELLSALCRAYNGGSRTSAGPRLDGSRGSAC
jgi:hypothetical protein